MRSTPNDYSSGAHYKSRVSTRSSCGEAYLPAGEVGLIGAVILATNLYTWHRTTLECERERTAEAEAQAQVFAEKESKIIANREAIYQELNQTRQLSNDQITNLKKRMVIYERNAKLAKSAVPPDSVGMFNAVSGLFPSVGRVPGSPPHRKV